MNPFSAFFSVICSLLGEENRAAEEREQQGPKGAAYSDALGRESMAYYQLHGTYDGFHYDAFDAQFDAYWTAHGNADGFHYQEGLVGNK